MPHFAFPAKMQLKMCTAWAGSPIYSWSARCLAVLVCFVTVLLGIRLWSFETVTAPLITSVVQLSQEQAKEGDDQEGQIQEAFSNVEEPDEPPRFCPESGGLRNKHTACDGPMRKPSGNASVALLIRGEAFRGVKGQYDRSILPTLAAVDQQKKATMSHMKFIIKPLELCGFRVDVFFSTYTPPPSSINGTHLLLDMYRNNLVAFAFHDPSARDKQWTQSSMYQDVVRLFKEHVEKAQAAYDGFLMIRFDLTFKMTLFDAPLANWSKILFPFHIWEVGSGQPGLVPQRVPDILHWCPWRLMNCLLPLGFMEHNALYGLTGAKGIGVQNIGFIFPNEYHDSNTAFDRNPLYKQTRPEQEFDVHGGFAILVVSVLGPNAPLKPQQLTIANYRLHLLALQGLPNPTHFTAVDFFVHTWDEKVCSKKELREAWGAKGQKVFCGCSDPLKELQSVIADEGQTQTNHSEAPFLKSRQYGPAFSEAARAAFLLSGEFAGNPQSCQALCQTQGAVCQTTFGRPSFSCCRRWEIASDGPWIRDNDHCGYNPSSFSSCAAVPGSNKYPICLCNESTASSEDGDKKGQLEQLFRFGASFLQSYRGIQWAKTLTGPYDRNGASYDRIFVGRIDHIVTNCLQLATFNVSRTVFVRFGPEKVAAHLPTEFILSDAAALRLFSCFQSQSWPFHATVIVGDGVSTRDRMLSFLAWCMKAELRPI